MLFIIKIIFIKSSDVAQTKKKHKDYSKRCNKCGVFGFSKKLI